MIEARLRGQATYVDDLPAREAVHVKLVLSPHPAALIVAIRTEAARSACGVVGVFTGEDVPLPSAPEPDAPLARGRVLWAGQPVVAVVAETYAAACDAAELVEVDYEPLPHVTTAEAALAPGAPLVTGGSAGGEDAAAHGSGGLVGTSQLPPNCTAVVRHVRGDTAAALAGSAFTVRRLYRVGATHQVPLEPHAVRAEAHADGRYTIWTSCQGGFDIRDATARLLAVDPTTIEVVPMAIGGGFGGKLLPLLEPLVCLLARRTSRTIHIALTRSEEFLFARGCPGGTVEIALGCDRDGRLTALEFRAGYDTGAGAGGLAAAGSVIVVAAYQVPNLLLDSRDVCTNKSPVTAYRAPGGPQGFFALESALDELAAEAGVDALELRLKNATRTGDPDLDGSPFPAVGFAACLETAQHHPLWTAPVSSGEGVGCAAGLVRGARQACSATLRAEPGGRFTLHVGSVDIAGTDRTLAIIAGRTAGIDPDRIRVVSGSTAAAPVAGAASGSKTTYALGSAVAAAARELRRQILEIATEPLEADVADLEIRDGAVEVRGAPGRGIALEAVVALTAGGDARQAPLLAHGRAGGLPRAPMFAVHLARVRVDPETGAVRVTGYAAIQDVGHAINPVAIAGQVHGGVAQGVGRALGEAIAYDGPGQLRTASLGDYLIPSADLIPDIEPVLVECPSDQGPLGARGAAEVPAIPAPAAMANAIARATGVRIDEIPICEEYLAGRW